MSPNEFRELCISEFNFLVTDYDCKVGFHEANPVVPYPLNSYEVFFHNSTSGITIKLEVIEKLPTIHIHRLRPIDGKRNVFAFGLLLLVRAPDLNPLKDETGLPLSKNIQTLIREYAYALRLEATDVLKGDFRVFPELQKEYLRQVALRLDRNSPRFLHF